MNSDNEHELNEHELNEHELNEHELNESEESNESNFDYAKDKLDNTISWLSDMYSRHPRENGMTGLQHFLFALKLSGVTLLSGLMLLVHAVAPWWLTTTGGDLLVYASDILKNSIDYILHNLF